MRCDLTASLLHQPSILFLDEPTIGLDAISKLAVRDFVRQLNRRHGITVILTTHDMDDIEAICDRVIVIHEGKIFSDGTLDKLRTRITTERRLIVDLKHENSRLDIDRAEVISRQGRRFTLRFEPEQITPAELITHIARDHEITDLFVENPPIEEIIAKLYGNQRS